MDSSESPTTESTGQRQTRSKALERVSDGVVSLDHYLRFTYVNTRAADLLDADAESLLGEKAWEVFPRARETEVQEAVERATETGQMASFQRYNQDTEQWWEGRVHPDESGITVLFSDITEKKERTYALERAETVFQNAQDGLFVIDVEDGGETFRISQANPAYETLLGAPAAELKGKTVRELTDEADSESIHRRYRECIDGPTSLEYEEHLPSLQDGSWWETKIAPVSADGTVTQIVGSTRNITERKEREEELRRKTRALDNAPVGVTISDPSQEDNPMTYVNEGFVEQTGYNKSEAIGRNCRFLQGEKTDPEQVADIRTAIDRAEPVETTLRNHRKDGTEFWNQLSIAPVKGKDGELESFVGFQRDVTEQRERKERLQTHELIIQAMNEVAFLVNDKKRIRFANDAALEFTDLPSEEIEGRPIGDITEAMAAPEEDPTRFTSVIESLLGDDGFDTSGWREESGTETTSLEFDFHVDSVGKVCTEQRFVPVELYDGGRGVAIVARDVTERREQEHEIQTHLLHAQEVGNIGSWYMEPDTGDLQLSDEAYRILGLEPGTMMTYERFLEMVHPEDRETVDSAWSDAIDAETDESEYRLSCGGYEIDHRISVDDEIRWLQTRAEVKFDADGTPESGIGVIRDITEQVQQTREIRAQKQRYESLFNSIGGAIVVTDTDGRIRTVNPGFTDLFGYDIDDIQGNPLDTITDDRRDVERLIDGPDATQESLTLDYRKKSGQVAPGESRSTPLWTHDETLNGHVIHIIDVSEKEENHEQLEVLGRVFRHNVKNDMNVIMAQAELIQKQESEAAMSGAKKILEKGQNFVRMASNQQKIAELLTKKSESDSIDLVPVVNKTVSELQEQYSDATLEVDVDRHSGCDASTVVEISDALRELVENAIVHSDRKHPNVTVRLQDTDACIEMQIEDDGPGIPEQEWDVVTGRKEINPLHHGTGLGLWFVNQVVRQSNGTLTLEKNGSQGSTVVVRLAVA